MFFDFVVPEQRTMAVVPVYSRIDFLVGIY
jgi:hypothetical protein